MADPPGPLLEREAEVACLEDAIRRAAAGMGVVVALHGPPGIGKTRLMAVATERARTAGFRVVSARGAALERDHAYGMVRRLTRHMALVPAEPATAAGDGAYVSLESLYRAVAANTTTRPLVLAADDLQWADPESLRFLSYLAVRLEGLRVLVLVAARPFEPGAPDELRSMLPGDGDGDTTVLEPAPLTPSAVAALVERAFGAPAPVAFVDACVRASGGNPFLACELVRALADARVSLEAANPEQATATVPASVTRAVASRVARLPPAAGRVARAVAVLGGTAPLELVVAMTGLEPADVGRAAEWLADADLFASGRPLRFRIPIVCGAVGAGMQATAREAAHRQAARVLAASGAAIEEVAAHLVATDPAADPWVAERLADAARHALARGAFGAARTLARRGLCERPPRELRTILAAVLGEAEVRARTGADAVDTLSDALRDAEAPVDRARLARWLGAALLQAGRPDDAGATLEAALAQLPAAERELRARLEEELRLTAYLSSTDRVRPARVASPSCGPRDHADRLSLVAQANDACLSGSADEAARLAELALDSGALLAEEGADSAVFHMAVAVLLYCDRLSSAERAYTAGITHAERHGAPLGAALSRSFRAGARLRQGALADAILDARAGMDARRLGLRLEPNPTAGFLIEALLERGDLAAAERVVADADLDGPLPDFLITNLFQHARGRLRAAQHDPAAGLEDHLACRRREEAWRVRTPALTSTRVAVAGALAALDDGGARREAELAVAEARAFGAPRALGVALTAFGVLSDDSDALTEGVDVLGRSEARLDHAHALVALGAALRRRGRRTDASARLQEGLRIARVCGATPLAATAYEELAASGMRPRKILRAGADALTPGELRVATLAAQGRTNQEIARALTLSPRTIETHLARAYQKLDIGSRRQLGEALGM